MGAREDVAMSETRRKRTCQVSVYTTRRSDRSETNLLVKSTRAPSIVSCSKHTVSNASRCWRQSKRVEAFEAMQRSVRVKRADGCAHYSLQSLKLFFFPLGRRCREISRGTGDQQLHCEKNLAADGIQTHACDVLTAMRHRGAVFPSTALGIMCVLYAYLDQGIMRRPSF